jgi:hypothetical protein
MAHAAGLRTNTDFQIEYFVEGSARTNDGKWALLWMQRNVLQQKIDNIPAYRLTRVAQKLKLESKLRNEERDWKRMMLEAQLIELEVGNKHWELSEQAWIDELEFTKDRMVRLESGCMFRDLPYLQRTEASQREEWCQELMYKCENFIVSTGTIPHDYLDACRMHPDFALRILPHIAKICDLRLKVGAHPAGMLVNLPLLAALPAPQARRIDDKQSHLQLN